jgi:hypothetical protein
MMNRTTLLLLIALILFLSSCAWLPINFVTVQDKQKGICYSCWWGPECFSRVDSDVSLAHLAETGAEWINLAVPWYQENIESTRISPGRSTANDEDLIHVLNQARSLGLKVMLRPVLALSDDASHGIGQIGQAFVSASKWREWFGSYQTFIEYYAGLAAAQGVGQFCVGSELKGTTHRDADWRALIAGVRSRYVGPLTYAGNHSDVLSITWWDALDFIGVEAYYRLSVKPAPKLRELRAAWGPIIGRLSSLSAKWRKPILFTEIGYRSINGAARSPADSGIQGRIDLQEQADCYQAAFESVYWQPWFAGMYWWSWSPNPEEGGPDDSGYSPHEKPAEEILRKWFGGALTRAPRWIKEPNPDRMLDIFSEGLGPGWEDRSWRADLDFEASAEPHGGSRSLRARLDPSGAVSLQHSPFFPYMHYFLEFYIRGSGGEEPLLWAYFSDREGKSLFKIPVNEPRYLDGGHIKTGEWTRVFIPLSDMGVARAPLQRLTFQDSSGKGTTVFWIDDLRLIGANWRSEPALPAGESALR